MAVDTLLASSAEQEPMLIGIRENRVQTLPLMQCVADTRQVAQAITEAIEDLMANGERRIDRVGVGDVEAEAGVGQLGEVRGERRGRLAVGLARIHVLEHERTSERGPHGVIIDHVGVHDDRIDAVGDACQQRDELTLRQLALLARRVQGDEGKRQRRALFKPRDEAGEFRLSERRELAGVAAAARSAAGEHRPVERRRARLAFGRSQPPGRGTDRVVGEHGTLGCEVG